jgi:hypothetical protein
VSTVGGMRSRSQPPRKSLSRRVSKDFRQGVNRPTTYLKPHHDLAGEMLSDPKRMEVRCGCGWQMRHARGGEGGWPHARCEGKAGESARSGQYALLCNDKLLKDIPKRICSHAMKLVVLFSRRVQCVVAWCRESLGGGGGTWKPALAGK